MKSFKEYIDFRSLKLRDYDKLRGISILENIVERVQDKETWLSKAINGEGLYQMKEFKEKVQLSERTIHRYINKGVISPLRAGNSFLFTDFDVIDIVEAHENRSKGGRPSKAQKQADREALAELDKKIDKYNELKRHGEI